MVTEPKNTEVILEPDLPIVDAHHHLWNLRFNQRMPRYLFDELNADINRGHNICKTVFVDCRSHYRADGPPEMRSVGETEFVNGISAMFASGLYGDRLGCAGIVSSADLALGDAVAPVLEKHIQAGAGRFRGVRVQGAWDADTSIGANHGAVKVQGRYKDPKFREGLRRLGALGLSFDAWVYDTQILEVADLADSAPDTPIVLDHTGGVLAIGAYLGQREAKFPAWRDSIHALAKRQNVFVKLGGMGMEYLGWPYHGAEPRAPSERLAADWKPYFETCIGAFGPERCMFESNFPVDSATCSYDALWNAFKRIAAGYSADEKVHLFSGTATRFYRL